MAFVFHFYWTFWWYDWMMHFLAGFIGGLAVFWVLFYLWFWRRKSDKILLPVLSVLFCLMVIGVGWEIAEYKFDITDSFEIDYADDVRNDLMADAAGAILAALLGLRATKKING